MNGAVMPMRRLTQCAALRGRRLDTAQVAVVIPACNEGQRIGACLAALAPQMVAARAAVVLVVNNTTDDTAELARARAMMLDLPLVLVRRDLRHGGVGAARRLGCAAAARWCPRAETILTTDADGTAAPDWIARMLSALGPADVVAGRIEAMDSEAAAFPEAFLRAAAREEAYCCLSREFERLMDPAGHRGGLILAGGANLGFRAAAYRQAGGFRRLTSGEDREIVHRMFRLGYRWRHVEDAVVRVSLRSDGRAPFGMAANIAARLAGLPVADSALRPLDEMLARHLPAGEGGRGAAPVIGDVLSDLAALRSCVAALRRRPGGAERLAFAARLLARRQLRSAPLPPPAALPFPSARAALVEE